MNRKIIIISIISLFFLMLFLVYGCSKGNEIINSEDNPTSSGSIKTVPEEQNMEDTGDPTEEGEQEASISESTTDIQQETEETYTGGESSNEENPDIISYKDIKVEIAQLYTIYAELHTSTVSININTRTGLIDGYILLGYDDTRPAENGRIDCASSLKGAISGIFDDETSELEGKIVGEIDADGELCFSDDIESTLTLKLVEDGKYIEGSFKVPIYTQFDFLLQRIN